MNRPAQPTGMPAVPSAVADAEAPAVVLDQSIGAILARLRDLSADQVERVLAHQREKGLRFGEAAVALGLASSDDVLVALAQQFHYPYAPEAERRFAPELVTLAKPFSWQAEAFRALRSQVMMRLFGTPDRPRRALAVVSARDGDGRTYVAANLAASLAQLGGRTLLVDADMRNPRQHAIFQLDAPTGLSGLLSGRAEGQVMRQVPGLPGLLVLPVGVVPPNPVELVERPAFGLLIKELVSKFDHVVVDTPAATLGSDGQIIAARCGAVLGVARKNATRVRALQELTAAIGQTAAEMIGFVVNEH